MIVKTVHVSYERKLNLGNYNSVAASCGTWVDVEEGESADDVIRALYDLVRSSVLSALEQEAPQHIAEVKEYFMGKEVR